MGVSYERGTSVHLAVPWKDSAEPSTGVPRSEETPPPEDPAVALCLGNYGDLREVVVSYERGTSGGGGYLGSMGAYGGKVMKRPK